MNPKDLTTSNENKYAFMRKMFIKVEPQKQYTDSSSYTHTKQMQTIGIQQNSTFYTKNNKREVVQSLRRLRNRS